MSLAYKFSHLTSRPRAQRNSARTPRTRWAWPLAAVMVLAAHWPAGLQATPPGSGPKQEEARKAKPGRAVVAEAKRRFTRANQLYRQGNYKEALLIYQAALDLYEDPVILYNMAQTYEKLRDPGMAAHFFERYLSLRPKSKDQAKVNARIAELKKRARVPVAVTSYPPGAAIYLGSRETGVRGRTPFILKVPLGPQKVILELAGFMPEERQITVSLGRQNLVDVQLKRRTSIRVDASVPGGKARLGPEDGNELFRLPHAFEVDPGKHIIWVGRQGYHPIIQEVEVEAGQQLSLLVDLKALPRYGKLQVEGVKGATVILEGKTLGHLPMKPAKVVEGTYGLQVTRDGFRPWEARVSVTNERLTVARVNLTSYRSTLANATVYGTAGLAVASLVTGAVMGFLAFRSEQDYNQNPTIERQQTGTNQAMAADILIGGAAASAAVAIITYFATARDPSTADVSVVEESP